MRRLLFLLPFIFMVACTEDANIPKDIIPQDKMGTVLWQVLQTDEFVSYAIVKDSTKNISAERLKRYKQVFDLNKITREDFDKSYHFYLSHPEFAKVMFDTLIARANRQRDEMNKIRPTPLLPLPKVKN